MRDARLAHLGAPDLARTSRDGHVVAARREACDQVTKLDRRPGEVVFLGIDVKNSQRIGHQAPKNSRTARATSSISASVWPAEIGSVRISSTSCSVSLSAAGARYSTAGCRWDGTG